MSFCASASSLAHLFRVLVVLTMLLGLVGTQASPGLGQEASPAPIPTEAPAETPTPGPTEAATSEPAQPTATVSAESTETATATIAETPTATATATAEVEKSESTGSLVITTVDENGSAVSGACYAVDYVGLYVCDANDGLDDSVTTLANVPAGLELTLRQAQTGAGYAIAEPTLFTLAAGQTKNLEIVNPHGATIAINVLDGDGNPAPGAWYYLFTDAGGGALGQRVRDVSDSSDGANDGTVTMSSLLPGSYVIYEYISPQVHVQAANVLVTVAAGEMKSIDIPHVPYSTVIIHTEDPDHVPLPGARYDAFEPDGPSRGAVGSGCDWCDGGPDDGTTVVRVPPGTWRLEQMIPPKDYLRAPNQEITVGERETLELTITNEPGAVITVHATDVWGNVVQYLSWSLYVDAGGGAHGALVAGASDDGGNGTAVFPPVPAGNYVIEPAYNSDVYLPAQPVQVTVTLGQHLDVTIPVPEHAPKMTTGPWIADLTQTSAVIQWGTDQLTIGYVDYGLTRNLGRVRPRTAQAPATFHQVTLDALTPDTLYYFRVRGASPNGDVLSGIYLFRTPAASADAAVVIKKVNSSSIPLGDSCFEVYKDAGSGRLGAYSGEACDKYDTSPNDGTLRINGLAAGAYVLVETRAPTGYAVAAPVRFSVTSGQTKTITVTNYRGGSTLTVTATTGFPPGTPGACFALYKDAGSGNLGAYVASACDDYDGLDALTTFVGLRAGNYVIWEWIVPDGYVRGENLPISIGTREVRSVDFINLSQTSGQTVRLRTADSTGKLLPGACFIIFPISGAASRYACDGWDGHVDGQTFFANVEDGQYSAFEVIAPTGYTVGKSTTFTKSFNRQITRTFTQVKGGTTVKVKTLNGGTSTLLKGACYALYKSSTGSLVTFACDGDGTLDGYTAFAGIPAGTYILQQFSTPPGYATPGDRTITVGTTSITFAVRTYKE